MKSVYEWFDDYGQSHRHPVNKTIHWICVPLIMLSLVGLLWSLPIPAPFDSMSPFLNWGVLLILGALIYYSILSRALAIGMTVFSFAILLITQRLDTLQTPLWQIALLIFVLAWLGQFVGHKIEGKKPSFFKDLQFLLIGPLWLLGFIYRAVGIRY